LAFEVNVKSTKKASIALEENEVNFLCIISLCLDCLYTALRKTYIHKLSTRRNVFLLKLN
jgi:hypothetical protein